MAILLPASPAPNAAQPFLVKFGGELTPFLGGPVQNIGRLGTRLGLRVTMPPMRGEVARQFQSRLLLGTQERVVIGWPLLDLEPIDDTASVSSSSSGSAISVSGLSGGLQEGQPFSVIHDGRRYMHISTGVLTGSSGAVGIFPYARVTYNSGDTIEVGEPKIEGLVSPGDEYSWSMALEHTMGFAFTVVETK